MRSQFHGCNHFMMNVVACVIGHGTFLTSNVVCNKQEEESLK